MGAGWWSWLVVLGALGMTVMVMQGMRVKPIAVTCGLGGIPGGPAASGPAAVAERFVRATTTAERLRWVRDHERVGAAVAAFFAHGPGATEQVEAWEPGGPAKMSRMTYERYEVRLAGGGERLLCVVPDRDGGKVDFECYARLGSVPWEQILGDEAGIAADVRVFIEAGNSYTAVFNDRLLWRNFTATSPDLEQAVELYAARGSATEQVLARLVAFGKTRATLAIDPLAGSHRSRQFRVTRVLAAGWVVEDMPSEPLSARRED
jgi:hypothetical protein